MKQMVVFDMDGTISQTHMYSVPAQRSAIKDLGRDDSVFTDEQLVGCLGKRGIDYVYELMPDLTAEEAEYFLKREFYWETQYIAELAAPFPGIRETIEKLHEDGILVAVCSNAPMEYIDLVVDIMKLPVDHKQELLPGLTKNDTLKLLLDRVKPSSAVMVGDRVYDIDAARFNNIPFVGCGYSYTPFEIEKADIIVSHGSEIYDASKKLLG